MNEKDLDLIRKKGQEFPIENVKKITLAEVLWNVQDVCEYFKIKPATVRYWCHVHAITYHKIGSLVRFSRCEVINDFQAGRLGKIGECKRIG